MRSIHSFLALFICLSCCAANNAQAQEPVETVQSATSNYWYPVFVKGKLGYIDSQGKLRINAELERVEPYKLENVTTDFIKADIGGKVALFNRSAKMIIDAKYGDIVVDTAVRLIRVSQPEEGSYTFMDDLIGFVDYQGRTVIPVSYHTQFFNAGYRFQEGLWCFEKDKLQGYMDKVGRVVIAPQFHAAYDFTNGMAAVQKDENGGWGYIDKSGKYVINASFASAGAFDEAGYALVKIKADDPTMSIINNKGKLIAKNIPYQATSSYLNTVEFHNGLFVVYDTVKKKYGYMDHNGKLATPMQFDYAEDFTKDGRALVNVGCITEGKGWLASHKGGKWGFIDVRGKMTTPYFRAEDASVFVEGLSPVKMNGLWGFVNEKGEVAIEPQWLERPSYFDGGLARVYEKSKLPSTDKYKKYMAIGYINKQGNYVWKIQE